MTEQGKKRIFLMDEVRGFAVICMVFYHAFFTIGGLFGSEAFLSLLKFFMPVEPFFAGAFILISGIASCLSRSNLKRGGKLFLIALGVTAVTALIVPEALILFGILHFLSVSMLLYGLLQKPLERIPFWAGAVGCVLFFLLTMQIGEGIFAFGIRLPEALYQSNWLFPIGIYSESFFSADYFPIFPWIFVFLFGTFLGRFAAAGKFPRFMYVSRVPFFSFVGRHALLIYVVHQPLIYGVAWLITTLCVH